MNRKLRNLLLISAVTTCSSVYAGPFRDTESTIPYAKQPRYQKIDRDFAHFSTVFFRHLAGRQQPDDYRSFNLIIAEARHAYKHQRPVYAITQIFDHESLFKDNINSKAIIETETLLLKANEINTARRLLKRIKNESDPSIVANVEYAFAEYYYHRDQWEKTIATIKPLANNLPPKKYQHAMLMQGVSLQNMRHHRKALALYRKIPASSSDYVAARINMALANLRQGWWTDTYDILSKLLKREDVRQNRELSDRIHTVIGYTFLQQAYYRNSRKAFRKVRLKGPYTKQALLGIALDAGYQKDYVGALNATRILKNKHNRELQVDEANLLLPYFYEKLGQMATASAGYSDAIKYYEGRLHALNLAIKDSQEVIQQHRLDDNTIINVHQERVDLGDSLPPAFFAQLSLLKAYRKDVLKLGDSSVRQEYEKLVDEFDHLMDAIVQSRLKKKANYLKDYMNQSRYGLARLYDQNLSDAK